MPLRNINSGEHLLFGVKTQLQFGKLFITSVFANQQSQRQTQNLQGGTSAQSFSLKADEYDENRHLPMGQYFRKNYNKSMEKLPVVNSRVIIQRVGSVGDQQKWYNNRCKGCGRLYDLAKTIPIIQRYCQARLMSYLTTALIIFTPFLIQVLLTDFFLAIR